MQNSEWSRLGPPSWHPDHLPDVDLVRPACCPSCGTLAIRGRQIFLHGHGRRTRRVVLPAVPGQDLRIGLCWVRRYRCTLCGTVTTVLPPGVLPRHLYSLMAIVRAFILVVAEPVGQGADDRLAYAVQGMKATTSWTKPWSYRWRSLDRWAARVDRWWPGRVAIDLHALLVGFLLEAGDDLTAILGRATASHVCCGGAM